MTKISKLAWRKAAEMALIVGATTTLILTGIFNLYVIPIAVVACIPQIKYLWKFYIHKRNETMRIMPKLLKKLGVAVEETEWSDDKSAVSFRCKYHDELFIFDCNKDSHYVHIMDAPWHKISVNDAEMQKYVEAANFVNSQSANMSVVIGNPDNNGDRPILTLCTTILPGSNKKEYLEHILYEMFGRKRDFAEALDLDMPWLSAPKSAIIVTPKHQED